MGVRALLGLKQKPKKAENPLYRDDNLIVFTDGTPTFDHFCRSALGKTAKKYCTPIDADAWFAAPKSGRRLFIRHGRRPTDEERRNIARHILNDTDYNDDKRHVVRHMLRIFGYTHGVDPLSHRGLGVVKSRTNSLHDGKVVEFPIAHSELREDVSYERLIDNRNADKTEVCDIRLVVLDGRAPHAYLKYRPVETRFSNDNKYCQLVAPTDALTATELATCLRFAETTGMDFGELDILRDRETGRLYIVDVTITPFGPPNHLPERETELALESFAKALDPLFSVHSYSGTSR
jgi:hypothetical protein